MQLILLRAINFTFNIIKFILHLQVISLELFSKTISSSLILQDSLVNKFEVIVIYSACPAELAESSCFSSNKIDSKGFRSFECKWKRIWGEWAETYSGHLRELLNILPVYLWK